MKSYTNGYSEKDNCSDWRREKPACSEEEEEEDLVNVVPEAVGR